MANASHSKEERYRVVLHGIGGNSEEEKSSFCKRVSENYGISPDLMKRITDRCPIVIKKGLPFKRAEMIAIAFKSSGASVSVERKRTLSPISLEYTSGTSGLLGLESASLRRSLGGMWQVFGRVKNLSKEPVPEVWTLIQLFDELNDLLTFEEIPLPIHPLPPGESSPFKAVFEGELFPKRITIAFKNASGAPLLTIDQRDMREWVEVKIAEVEKRESQAALPIPLEEPLALSEPILSPVPEREEEGQRVEEVFPENGDAGESGLEEPAFRLMEGDGVLFEQEKGFDFVERKENRSQEAIPSFMVEKIEEEEELHLHDFQEPQTEEASTLALTSSSFEEMKAVLGEPPVQKEEALEERLSYPWLDDFRKAVVDYLRAYPDPFLLWFEKVQEERGFEDEFHALLTLLIYGRFNQNPPQDTALRNTQKVFRIAFKEDFDPEAVPHLEGVLFFPDEVWRDLFIRALPKLQEVSRQILEKGRWEPTDLDRLVRVIPHMSVRNSRWVIRLIHDRFQGVVPDVSGMEIDVNESIYRIASRLGVVNPLFDYYQGKHSMGDWKIQSFMREAFPDDPGKIEEPLNRLGGEGEGGHCFPTEPRCANCPFEAFCQKLFLHLDPAVKGMLLRS